jgi:hypothetical protein
MATEVNFTSLCRTALWCACALLTDAAAAHAAARISGSDTGGWQVPAPAFLRTNTAVKVVVQPALGNISLNAGANTKMFAAFVNRAESSAPSRGNGHARR